MALDVDLIVHKSVLVEASPERAFEVFTEGFSTWWPLESHHIGEADAVEAVIEPRTGGRWFERGADGSECDWGRVLAWEPPFRLRLAWMLNSRWQFDPDDARATEIEITFAPEGAGTRVDLVHGGFDRVADGAEIRDAVGGDGGWGGLLQRFAAEAASRA